MACYKACRTETKDINACKYHELQISISQQQIHFLRKNAMTISMYHASVPRIENMLKSLLHILDKAEKHAESKKWNEVACFCERFNLNLLLIRENEPLDSLLVKESARLIRSQWYVSELALNTRLVSKDSVDISIRILDSWSALPELDLTNTQSTFLLSEKNFFGLGHEFSNSYSKNFMGIHDGYSGSYIIPNIKNTFIKTTLAYSIDFNQNYTKLVSVERPFYSTFTRWAGGFSLSQIYGTQFTFTPTQTLELQRYKADYHDYWVGHSVKIFKGNSL